LRANATEGGATVAAREALRKATADHRNALLKEEVTRRANALAEARQIAPGSETKKQRADRRAEARELVKSDEGWGAFLEAQQPDPSTLRLRASCRKLRMYPTKRQRAILDTYLRGAKATWNMAADLVNKRQVDLESLNAMELDRRVVFAEGLLAGHGRAARFVRKTPTQIRKMTTRRFAGNLKSALKNEENAKARLAPEEFLKRKPIAFRTETARRSGAAFGFEAQYTTLHVSDRSSDCWVRIHTPDTPREERGTLFAGRIKLQRPHRKDRDPIHGILEACRPGGRGGDRERGEGEEEVGKAGGMTIVRKRGRYTLCIPVFHRAPDDTVVAASLSRETGKEAGGGGKRKKTEKPPRTTPDGDDGGEIDETKIVALDPGVRTFLTGFCPGTGETLEFGPRSDLKDRLDRANRKRAGIEERIAERKKEGVRRDGSEAYRAFHRKMRGLRNGIRKYAGRAENLMQQFHAKTACDLLERFEHVILPRFSTRNIHKLKLPKAEERFAKQLNHFKFRGVLQDKTWKYSGRVVWLCSEFQTTMCCGRCGVLNRDVGSSETFRCAETRGGKCPLEEAPRDAHAARNIYLKTCFGSELARAPRKGIERQPRKRARRSSCS
jgi:transposase